MDIGYVKMFCVWERYSNFAIAIPLRRGHPEGAWVVGPRRGWTEWIETGSAGHKANNDQPNTPPPPAPALQSVPLIQSTQSFCVLWMGSITVGETTGAAWVYWCSVQSAKHTDQEIWPLMQMWVLG